MLHSPGSSKWYIVYHRRPLGETDRNHRVVSVDEPRFDARVAVAAVVDGEPALRDPLEIAEVRAFREEEIPLDELSFDTRRQIADFLAGATVVR